MLSRTHPLRFLLYLEWMLLGIVVLSESLPLPHPAGRLPGSSLLNLLAIGLFAVMGLRLPSNWTHRAIYTSLEVGLILWVSLVGGVRLFALLYIVLVIRNCLIFDRDIHSGWFSPRSIVTAIAFLLYVLTQWRRLQYLQTLRPAFAPERSGLIWLSSLLLFGLVAVFLQLLVNAVLAERQSREQLAAANTQLRQYALRVEEMATLQERNRIAREIHDSLGHSLTVFNLHLEAALRLLQSHPAEARDLLVEAKQVGATALREVRQSVGNLRADPLQRESLEAAIGALVDDFRRSTHTTPTYLFLVTVPLTTDIKTATYRIVQEALTNISKHAAATQVSICIEATSNLRVTVQDNGKGFDLSQNATGFGLQGMRERTLALSGNFELITALGKGCRIVVDFPLAGRS